MIHLDEIKPGMLMIAKSMNYFDLQISIVPVSGGEWELTTLRFDRMLTHLAIIKYVNLPGAMIYSPAWTMVHCQ